MSGLIKIVSIFGLGFLVFMGGISHGAPDIPALRDCNDPAERARIQGLIKGAQAEGKLVIAGSMVEPDMAKNIFEGFRSYYGLLNLTPEYTYQGTGATVTRVDQILNAGRPGPDIVWNVAWAWYKDLLSRGQIMKYDSPMYKDYTISHKVGNSMPGYWVSDSYTFSPMWNPEALAKAGIKDFNPTSWWDFTDPKLVRLTSLGNIAISTSLSSITIGLRKALGDEWFKKIVPLKPAIWGRAAQGGYWCATGEYPVSLYSHAKNAEALKAGGFKVKMIYPKEGIVLLPFAPIILTSAQHPNLAKLFIDYIRSRPGTDRIADSRACLLYGRPGVKTPLKEFLPAAEEIKAIAMNWNVEDTPQSIREMQKWVVDIGLCY